MNLNSLIIKYWTIKLELINQLRLSREHKSIVVIDDDDILCSMLQKLNFEVYRAEITKNVPTQTHSVKFSPPQIHLMTELQLLLRNRHGEEKRAVEVF